MRVATDTQYDAEVFEFCLLNSFQRNFPLTPEPFAQIAGRLGSDQATVLSCLQDLQQRGLISRVGAVFRPNTVGASALAALAVPPHRLEQVAAYVSARAEINHNYQREHHFNLWFVAAAASGGALRLALQEIEQDCASGEMLVLPMLEEFHIDLGFDLAAETPPTVPVRIAHSAGASAALNASGKILLAALQHGLPLAPQPYTQLGLPQEQALQILQRWVDDGVIKRFGVIVRHHELGFNANAMLVWDVPDAIVGAVGQRIAASGLVSLCYRRPRQLPQWPYNLFCMMHGRDREEVEARIARLSAACGVREFPRDTLFSQRRFKQRGAHYVAQKEAAYG
ncbi:MAG: Lrp/AsnC family transcriptional regulator [Burkholderiales bacterium]|nr:Lrp/AsnC family transcriptional regulator [Burkholderiales bacterium]